MTGKRLLLEVTLLDDLHTGTGGSAGQIDAVQAVDKEGQPILRGTHIRGVLRAMADELAILQENRYKNLATKLFGSDKHGVRGQLMVQSLYRVKKKKPENWSKVWSSTSRENDAEHLSRSAKGDTLRVVEFVAAGTVFSGEIFLQDATLEDDLRACIKRLRFLGGRRSRGDGLVQCQLTPIINTKSKLPLVSTATTLRLLLQNSDPICLAITGNPGNIIPSEGYIRGQRLQGALFAWALHHAEIDVPLFEKVSVGNAFPLPDETEQQLADFKMFNVLPTPQFIGEKKTKVKADDSGLPYWAKASTKMTKSLSSEAQNRFYSVDRQLKRPKGYQFLAKLDKESTWLQYQPTMQIHMRNKLATHDLFSEQEIVEKTYFLADIEFHTVQAATQFAKLFKPIIEGEQPLSIGRGGRAIWVEKADFLLEKATANFLKFDVLTLSLESDLIARVINSQILCPLFNFYTRLTPECLLDLLDMSFSDWETHWTFKEFSEETEIRGFNAATGLQRMPVMAILQGSALCIESKTDKGKTELKHLIEKLVTTQKQGLGERGAEGFGRFRINFDPLLSNTNKVKHDVKSGVSVNSSEHILNIAQSSAAILLSKKTPSRQQWRWFLSTLQRTNNLKDVLELAKDQSEIKCGANWKNVLSELKLILENDKIESKDHVALVEAIIRYIEVKTCHHTELYLPVICAKSLI